MRSLWTCPLPAPAPIPIAGPSRAKPAPAGPLRVCVWNVQYGAGREQLFFYDGGDAVSVPRATVMQYLERIAQAIERIDADVVLLQEIDRGSRRTGFVDQHAWLAARLAYPWHASTTYHRVRYVPAPPQEHLGRVDMHLSIFSRYTLLPGTRHALPLLHESWLRQQFNLRRALMAVPIDRVGGPAMLFHTHLSAFSHGDRTVPRQLARIGVELAHADAHGMPWLLAGDFNALPPGDDPGRLGADAELYCTPSPLAPLYGSTVSAVPLSSHRDDAAAWRTWVPFRATAAERALDHAFGSPTARFTGTHVARHAMGISDHLPLVFDVAW